jgi:hypothetical protein
MSLSSSTNKINFQKGCNMAAADSKLKEQMQKAQELDEVIKENLRKIGYE